MLARKTSSNYSKERKGALEVLYYVEKICNSHSFTVHYRTKTVERRGSIQALIKEMDSELFFCPHGSFIVNAKCVSSVSRTSLVLTNGAVIPISRSRQTEVKEFLQRCSFIKSLNYNK